MSGRTYVVIFFFWAALTLITPTLIFLSETSKPYLDSNGEKIEGIKARRMIEIMRYQRSRAPTEAPAPTPTSDLKPALETRETNLGKGLLESLRLVIKNTKFKLT
ncbi:hypothetical protein CerSpe_040530 [Prunus speciosa]|uniref:Uncharacterized protein LOC110771869 n=1 Tax=Prunus avium TaxID=42229 RepID=A0A6P5TY00_PRUAV|nr:uncharacterized protein LOC110771869 [Prunus avium]